MPVERLDWQPDHVPMMVELLGNFQIEEIPWAFYEVEDVFVDRIAPVGRMDWERVRLLPNNLGAQYPTVFLHPLSKASRKQQELFIPEPSIRLRAAPELFHHLVVGVVLIRLPFEFSLISGKSFGAQI